MTKKKVAKKPAKRKVYECKHCGCKSKFAHYTGCSELMPGINIQEQENERQFILLKQEIIDAQYDSKRFAFTVSVIFLLVGFLIIIYLLNPSI